MSFQARFAVALACVLAGAALPAAGAPPSHRPAFVPSRPAGDAVPPPARAATERQLPPHAAGARRPEAQRPPAPSLWNPLKRKRMAMPPPPATDVDYAF